jgi:aminopeptidase N
MARDAQLHAREYIALALDNVGAESDASTLQTLIGRIERAVESYSQPAHRSTARALLARAAHEHFGRAKPGGDTQLLWALTFIGAARLTADIEWVHGLLDGTTQPPGGDLIARELERDPSAEGQRRAAAARAARPLEAAKREAWERVIHDPATSHTLRRAIASGFHRIDQQELLSEFVRPYFDSLLPVWETHDSDEAISIVQWMYPRAVITLEVVDATDAALATDLPGPVRRSLLENQDSIRRALRAQAFDSAGTDSRRDA